ncbi:hypothetical protein GE21DRAFT_1220294 [Neurospora crassa]|nr:hypothetical protein GE21DRAFT_1220294 [Neurospora crassa]
MCPGPRRSGPVLFCTVPTKDSFEVSPSLEAFAMLSSAGRGDGTEGTSAPLRPGPLFGVSERAKKAMCLWKAEMSSNDDNGPRRRFIYRLFGCTRTHREGEVGSGVTCWVKLIHDRKMGQ